MPVSEIMAMPAFTRALRGCARITAQKGVESGFKVTGDTQNPAVTDPVAGGTDEIRITTGEPVLGSVHFHPDQARYVIVPSSTDLTEGVADFRDPEHPWIFKAVAQVTPNIRVMFIEPGIADAFSVRDLAEQYNRDATAWLEYPAAYQEHVNSLIRELGFRVYVQKFAYNPFAEPGA